MNAAVRHPVLRMVRVVLDDASCVALDAACGPPTPGADATRIRHHITVWYRDVGDPTGLAAAWPPGMPVVAHGVGRATASDGSVSALVVAAHGRRDQHGADRRLHVTVDLAPGVAPATANDLLAGDPTLTPCPVVLRGHVVWNEILDRDGTAADTTDHAVVGRHPEAAPDIPIQDVGGGLPRHGGVPVHHTHGGRQWHGTCRLHLHHDCPHLVHWTPGRLGNGRLGKTIMRAWYRSMDEVHPPLRCRTCWPRDGAA